MIPDKIYIPQNINRSDVTSLSFPDDKGRGIEFVRKEALMEILKKEEEWRRESGDDYYLPVFNFIHDLIDKLNSM